MNVLKNPYSGTPPESSKRVTDIPGNRPSDEDECPVCGEVVTDEDSECPFCGAELI